MTSKLEEKEKTELDKYDDLLDKSIDLTKDILKFGRKTNNKKINYLPYWKLKESKLLLREMKYPRKYFSKYKRGTIIKVDFGVNIGSEFSQKHYAIVLNKNDNRVNKTLNVIPLTSKEKTNNYNIGNVIFENFVNSLKENMEKLYDKLIEEEMNNNETSKINKEIDKLTKVAVEYAEKKVSSFACYQNITTISKTRILPPINEYDIVCKACCPKETMDKIDEKIIEYYTNIMN